MKDRNEDKANNRAIGKGVSLGERDWQHIADRSSAMPFVKGHSGYIARLIWIDRTYGLLNADGTPNTQAIEAVKAAAREGVSMSAISYLSLEPVY